MFHCVVLICSRAIPSILATSIFQQSHVCCPQAAGLQHTAIHPPEHSPDCSLQSQNCNRCVRCHAPTWHPQESIPDCESPIRRPFEFLLREHCLSYPPSTPMHSKENKMYNPYRTTIFDGFYLAKIYPTT
jgi:hypothetical protein